MSTVVIVSHSTCPLTPAYPPLSPRRAHDSLCSPCWSDYSSVSFSNKHSPFCNFKTLHMILPLKSLKEAIRLLKPTNISSDFSFHVSFFAQSSPKTWWKPWVPCFSLYCRGTHSETPMCLNATWKYRKHEEQSYQLRLDGSRDFLPRRLAGALWDEESISSLEAQSIE